jgi:phage N-6-adenine-methyltransferase
MTAALRKIAVAGAHTEWATPPELFERLNREFSFGLDVCASAENAKLPWYFTEAEDALSRPWRCDSGAAFMNPPYGRGIEAWVRKAYAESREGVTVVGLLPANTDTRWFHDYVMRASEIRFLRGRVKFLINGKPKGTPNFGSLVAVWRPGSVAPVIGAMEA